MKIIFSIFLVLLVLQSKFWEYISFDQIGICWGGNYAPFSVRIQPFLKSVLFSLILEYLFSGLWFGFTFQSLVIMLIVELVADLTCFIIYKLYQLFRFLSEAKDKCKAQIRENKIKNL